MLNGPRDPWAYRIAIAALGFAVAVVFGGICLVAATPGEASTGTATFGLRVPMELWFTAGALSGVFVGALIPFRLRGQAPEPDCSCTCCGPRRDEKDWGSIAGGISLMVVGVAATVVGLVENLMQMDALGATIAGVLLGLPIPSPGRRDQ